MLDSLLEKSFAPMLDRFAPVFAARAKFHELVLFCVGLVAAAAIARHWVFAGLALFAASRLAVSVAARAAVSDVSAVYGTVAFAALPFAFALEAPVRALPAVFLMFAMSANAAANLKLGARWVGESELLFLFLLAALFPDWFGPIAYVGGVLCFVASGVAAARRD